jgi:hypothetical protein
MTRITSVGVALGLALPLLSGCSTSDDGSSSEVATGVVSGALNSTAGSKVGWNDLREKRSPLQKAWDFMNPIRPAWAADWACSGGSLAPTFSGPGTYTFTPVSCSIEWRNGRTASSEWSSTFALDYGQSCDDSHPWMEQQAAGCSLTRTTATGGNARTITGPNGNAYTVTHDTNGAGTGWDSSVTPAPTNAGVVLTCGSTGCAEGKTLVINGSHVTGTVELADGSDTTRWDHTITSSGLTVTGSETGRVVTGSVTVQHNIAKYVATVTFNSAGYGDPLCCFPTSGSVTATFSGGSDSGKSETLAFSAACAEATLTTASGTTESVTLQHCL